MELRLLGNPFMRADPVLYADMEAYLRSGEWQIAYESPTALWLCRSRGGLHAVAAFDPDEARRLLADVPLADMLVLRGCAGLRELAAERGFNGCTPCRQSVYDAEEPPSVRAEVTIRHPDAADFPQVAGSYGMVDEAALRADFDGPDFLGAYLDGAFVGYVGVHGEGSMGLLHVFPPYRRRGYAEALVAALIERRLRRGWIPFAQILADNEASLQLQRKLGLRLSDGLLYWMWHED